CAGPSGFSPYAVFGIFDMLMRGESRDIVLFVNWMAWDQATRGRSARWLRAIAAAGYYGGAIGRLLGTIRRGRRANDGKDFSATQANGFLDAFTVCGFTQKGCPET